MAKGQGASGNTGGGRKRAIAVVNDSPVELSRSIPELTKLTLIARAAGRCEFRGCNKYLYEHTLTTEPGNFGEFAHVVAFKIKGPRGAHEGRPVEINGIENLMLLCEECHHNIDNNALTYPREVLLGHKREHEARIRLVGGLGPELRTNVLTLKSMIGERLVEITGDEVVTALRPRYPSSSAHRVIDLTQLGDESEDGYYPLADRRIRQQVQDMYAAGGAFDTVKHLSVFGLATIPLLVVLGLALSNTIPTDLFQCHRDREDRWTWHEGQEPARYATKILREGTDPHNVALVLSLSGTIGDASLPAVIDASFSVYVMTLDSADPNPGFLRQREDLEAFRLAYRQLLARIAADHSGLRTIHLFPAAPAPIAISLGFDLLPKVHPALAVYDFDKRVGGFTERIRVNHYE